MDEREHESDPPTAYPIPEATVAGDPNILVAILASILGVLFFWRKKKPDPVEADDSSTE